MTTMSFRIRNLLLALAVAAGAAGAAAGPALAADWHYRDRPVQHWRYHHPPPVVYGAPYNYVVAPPPVVVAAPVPMPSASFNLVVPLTIR